VRLRFPGVYASTILPSTRHQQGFDSKLED
jgi:hypothetical protein